MKNGNLKTKANILHESYHLFLTENIEKVTIKDIEKATSRTRGAIFYYFKDKQCLFEAVVDNFYFKPMKEFYNLEQKYGTCIDFNSFLKKYKSPSERIISHIKEMGANMNVGKAFFHFTFQASKYYPEFDTIYNRIIEEYTALSNILSHMVGNTSNNDLETIVRLFLCLNYGSTFYNTFASTHTNIHSSYFLNKLI
ncbi:MAG: TetR/AcrR family transcriptional regulator [Bacteroidales bacterium]|jgi:AcrR family transcriptional regulator|nr:TetR/AcrR family transcriptional regulator [Bacteroidales bacterium]